MIFFYLHRFLLHARSLSEILALSPHLPSTVKRKQFARQFLTSSATSCSQCMQVIFHFSYLSLGNKRPNRTFTDQNDQIMINISSKSITNCEKSGNVTEDKQKQCRNGTRKIQREKNQGVTQSKRIRLNETVEERKEPGYRNTARELMQRKQ